MLENFLIMEVIPTNAAEYLIILFLFLFVFTGWGIVSFGLYTDNDNDLSSLAAIAAAQLKEKDRRYQQEVTRNDAHVDSIRKLVTRHFPDFKIKHIGAHYSQYLGWFITVMGSYKNVPNLQLDFRLLYNPELGHNLSAYKITRKSELGFNRTFTIFPKDLKSMNIEQDDIDNIKYHLEKIVRGDLNGCYYCKHVQLFDPDINQYCKPVPDGLNLEVKAKDCPHFDARKVTSHK